MVEADLSRFGLFQLEGLVRSNQFDLVVHSTRSLPSEMQGTIKGIYQESLNTGDLAGTIRFKGGATKPFNPTGGIHSQTDLPDGHVAAIVV